MQEFNNLRDVLYMHGGNLKHLTVRAPPYDEYRKVIVDAGIKIVETAGSNPAPHLPMFHENGIKVLHKRRTRCLN